ncbi:hypothetical protein EDD11_002047, partial [Mortierella claussenii]
MPANADAQLRAHMATLARTVDEELQAIARDSAHRCNTLLSDLTQLFNKRRSLLAKDIAHFTTRLRAQPARLTEAVAALKTKARKDITQHRNRSQDALNKNAARRQAAEAQVHASATRQQRIAISAFQDREQRRAAAAAAKAARRAEKRNIKAAQRAEKRNIKAQKAAARVAQMRIRNEERRLLQLPPIAASMDRTATFPLMQPVILPPEASDDSVVRMGPLLMPVEQAISMAQIQSRLPTTDTRGVYSDGSLIAAGTDNIAMAFSVVDTSQATGDTLQGRVDGYASSTKAELMGLIAAVIAQPKEQDLLIHLDNSAVVQQFEELVKKRQTALPRKRQRATYAGLWAVLAKL